MPDRTRLKVGDRIRILRVPDADQQQREREMREHKAEAGYTADTIERIILSQPVVTIRNIDEYGYPWLESKLAGSNGKIEYHSLAIIDDESWDFA